MSDAIALFERESPKWSEKFYVVAHCGRVIWVRSANEAADRNFVGECNKSWSAFHWRGLHVYNTPDAAAFYAGLIAKRTNDDSDWMEQMCAD